MIIVKVGWHLCHTCIEVANQSHILPRGQLEWFLHLVAEVAFLLGETLFRDKVGDNMIHYYS